MANGYNNGSGDNGNGKVHILKTQLGLAGVLIAVCFAIIGYLVSQYIGRNDIDLAKAQQEITAIKLSNIALQGKVDTLAAQMTQLIGVTDRLDGTTRATDARVLRLEVGSEKPKR